MIHRHLDYDGVPVEQLGLAALDDLLDRGDFSDWRPLARAVAANPFGPLANSVLHLCDAHPMQGTSPLWREWIAARRARAAGTWSPGLPFEQEVAELYAARTPGREVDLNIGPEPTFPPK